MNSELEIELVIDNLPSAIIVVDQNRKVLLANKTAEMFAHKSKKEFYGRYVGEAFGCVNSRTVPAGCGHAPACAFCTVKNTVLETLDSKEGKTGIETRMHFFDAGERTLRISTTYLSLLPQAAVILAMEDITDLKRMEEERLAREKFQGVLEMAGAVCHELNQPMQAISAYSELLLLEQPAESVRGEDLEGIRMQVLRMRDITKKLMGITRYETRDYVFPGKRIIDIHRSSSAA